MSLDAVQSLLRQLGAKIGIPELQADQDGYCGLVIGEVELHLQHRPETADLIAFCDLGTPADEERGPLLERLMEANLFWEGTGGSTLGMQPENGAVFLADRVAVQVLDFAGFERFLESFVQAAERWKPEVAGVVTPEAAEAATLPSPELTTNIHSDVIRG